MTVCLAQVRSLDGDVVGNVDRHLGALRAAGPHAPDLVVFPELSLSNYAPETAGAAALTPGDPRLAPLQRHADATGTAVAVGAPLKTSGKPTIALLVFRAGRPAAVVGKRHLHPDEAPFFSPAGGGPGVLDLGARVGVAICYEVAVAGHADALAREGVDVYLASVAKTARGVAEARATLAATARRLGVPALLVNSVGTCEGRPAGGGSFALDRDGRPLARLGSAAEGLLVVDTDAATAAPVPGPSDPAGGPVPGPPSPSRSALGSPSSP